MNSSDCLTNDATARRVEAQREPVHLFAHVERQSHADRVLVRHLLQTFDAKLLSHVAQQPCEVASVQLGEALKVGIS